MPDDESHKPGSTPSDWAESDEDEEITNVTAVPAPQSGGAARARPAFVVVEGANLGDVIPLDAGDFVIGRGSRAEIRFDDVSMSRRQAAVKTFPGGISIEDLQSSAGTFVNGAKLNASTPHILKEGDKIRVGVQTVLRFHFMDRLDEGFQRKMFDLALRDPLTAVFNKRYFLDRLQRELAYARRHASELCLLLVDADFFKAVNDRHGHVAGDAALKHIAHLGQATLRAEDVFARYGGEEFAVLTRGIPLAKGAILGERIRARVAANPLSVDDEVIALTVSVGVAEFPAFPAETAEALIHATDEALYAAKREGRNRVKLYAKP